MIKTMETNLRIHKLKMTRNNNSTLQKHKEIEVSDTTQRSPYFQTKRR